MPIARRIAICLGALAALAFGALGPGARARTAADGTGAAILRAIDRVPEGTNAGNPHAWNGAFTTDADILSPVAPYRFGATVRSQIFDAFAVEPLTRTGAPRFEARAHETAYDVVGLRQGVGGGALADGVFVTTIAAGDPGYSISAYAFVPATGADATATTAEPELLAPVRALAAAARADTLPNAAARAAIAAAYVASPVIVDDVAPYRFTGSKAVARWTAAFERSFARAHIRNVRMTLAVAEFVRRAGTRATFVVPMHVAFTAAGKAHSADGRWLFIVERSAERYRIVASVWAELATS